VFHNNVNAVISEPVLSNAQLLQALVILEHLSEMDGNTLADSFVNWIVYV
jgi:hypothetical protein